MPLRPHIKGDTFNGLFITVNINGVPLDLTDVEISVHFRFNSKTSCDVHKYSVGSGIIITDATAGKFSLLADTVLNWKVGKWYFDVQFTLEDGSIKTYYSDILTITQDVTV